MLEALHLTKKYDSFVAVRDISLRLEPERIVALVGASGSGKSTLLNLLAGLSDADDGVVKLNGVRVPGPSEVLVAGQYRPGEVAIRMVHQEYQLMPNISIRENIAYALRFYDKTYREGRVDQLLKRCRLTEVQNRLPRQVSGGEKQRTAIARAVADKPAVLLLDEPFSHLDLPNRLIVRDLLFDLVRDDAIACLFVTHDATDALSIADTLGILRDGRLIQIGSPIAVYQQPKTAYAARLTGPVNIIKAKYLPLLGLPESETPESLICLRPEQILLADADPAPAVNPTGTVKAVFFRGSHYEVEVELSRYLCVRLLTTRADLQVGKPVPVRVAAESVWPGKRLGSGSPPQTQWLIPGCIHTQNSTQHGIEQSREPPR